MKQYYYYSSIRKTIVQFLDIFKSVKIERKDRNGATTGYIKVPLKFTTKEKVWYWLHERKNEEMLPMMSVVLSSVDYSSERQVNKTKKILKSASISEGEMSRFLNPVPYNLGFNMTVWALHMVDVDQILEQILPFFNPSIFIRINVPELDATLDLKVVFNGCAPDVTSEMQDDEMRIVKWTLDFIVQGYLFRPIENNEKLIKKIIQKYYIDEFAWGHRFTETEFTSGASGSYEDEAVYIKGINPYFNENNWESSTEYEIGDIVKPTTSNGYLYSVISLQLPCKSGSMEPTWTTNKETPIPDNNVIWELYEKDEYKKLCNMEIF